MFSLIALLCYNSYSLGIILCPSSYRGISSPLLVLIRFFLRSVYSWLIMTGVLTILGFLKLMRRGLSFISWVSLKVGGRKLTLERKSEDLGTLIIIRIEINLNLIINFIIVGVILFNINSHCSFLCSTGILRL